MRALFLVVALCASSATVALGQSSDEQKIRELISLNDQGKRLPATSDNIFWSGPFKKPIVAPEKPDPIPDDGKPGPDVVSQTIATQVVRIEVAKSGELAYEFSNFTLTNKMSDGKDFTFTGSLLRAWKKEADQWKVAAVFFRPHWTPETK